MEREARAIARGLLNELKAGTRTKIDIDDVRAAIAKYQITYDPNRFEEEVTRAVVLMAAS